jgi:hypothetical protein
VRKKKVNIKFKMENIYAYENENYKNGKIPTFAPGSAWKGFLNLIVLLAKILLMLISEPFVFLWRSLTNCGHKNDSIEGKIAAVTGFKFS